MKAYDIVTVSDLGADLLLFGKDITPEFGQREKIGDSYCLDIGGSCSIFACQAAKLGLKTATIGTVAKDVMGRLVCERLKEAGVDTAYIKEKGSYTALSVAHCMENDRAILTFPGTFEEIEYGEIPRQLLESTRHLHIGSYYLLRKMIPYWPEIISIIHKAGGTVSLDTNYDPEEKWALPQLLEILPMIDIFLPNETELCRIMQETDILRALRKAHERVRLCVVKRGKDGASSYFKGKEYHWPAETVPVCDTVGAGDTFDAGFLYGYLNGMSLEDCGKIAVFCSSGNIQKQGGVAGQRMLTQLQPKWKPL